MGIHTIWDISINKIILALLFFGFYSDINSEQFRVGVVGLSHSHVHWIFNRADTVNIKIVGIVEKDLNLAKRFAENYGFSMEMVYESIEKMNEECMPEGVTAFGSIFEHLEIVEKCAPLGIHVMVEKPLAVSLAHAIKMKNLAEKYNIYLLTNYETTWYPTNHETYSMINEGLIGKLRKIVVNDGHKGPKEIGVNEEFLDWLTDPILNGGGAVTDFGCYGANLITWLKNGELPESIFAFTKTYKPHIYPKVDDEATIILQYSDMQGIIQASWNWPFSRKDMEVYGTKGYVISKNRNELAYRTDKQKVEKQNTLKERYQPYNDPFSYFAALVREEISPIPNNLSSLENNMKVIQILEAAKKSAKTGRVIKINKN